METLAANREKSTPSRLHIALLMSVLVMFAWSGIHPHDYFTWLLEVVPAIIGVGILIATYKRFGFTWLVYVLVAIHAVILMVGGHYTYAEVPLGYWIKEAFHQARNNYDKIGHFAQGFRSGYRLARNSIADLAARRGGWLSFIVICICLAISASYELFEWAVAVFSGSSADAFLGTQGDPWDTQSDMLLALIGATVALAASSKVHDRMLEESGH